MEGPNGASEGWCRRYGWGRNNSFFDMPYDPNIHHRKSIRLKGYDYSQAGMYFITLCVQDKLCLFGEVVNGEMVLNDAGRVANACWLNIPEHFPNAILYEHIVMPNYVHGIIEFVGANHYSP